MFCSCGRVEQQEQDQYLACAVLFVAVAVVVGTLRDTKIKRKAEINVTLNCTIEINGVCSKRFAYVIKERRKKDYKITYKTCVGDRMKIRKEYYQLSSNKHCSGDPINRKL